MSSPELPAKPQNLTELALAARYAPVIHFDASEPFLPSYVGYIIFYESGPSSSFPREINLTEPGKPTADVAIEYAIWWDWDIQHLYELEHAWVFLDSEGRVIRGEASWHGGFHHMAVDGHVPLTGERLTLLSEPGKHAFAPTVDWLEDRTMTTRKSCGHNAGKGGVWITPLFDGIIDVKTPLADQLVLTYLEKHAFEPSMDFSQAFHISAEMLIDWGTLNEWIPRRVAWWVEELTHTIPVDERRVLRIGHRGASGHAPENTLAAIAKAAELGADMVELDVQTSADGVPIIIHDMDVSRISDGSGPVSQHTLATLKQLDVGNGERIPTLAEAIACCREHHIGIYFELKSGSAIRPLVEHIQQERIYSGVIVGSFRPDWVAQVKQLDPKIKTSVLFGATQLDPVKLAQAVGATYVHPCWENAAPEPHKLLTSDWIDRVHTAGLGIICWHEERPVEIAALLQLGVQGICSDMPELLVSV